MKAITEIKGDHMKFTITVEGASLSDLAGGLREAADALAATQGKAQGAGSGTSRTSERASTQDDGADAPSRTGTTATKTASPSDDDEPEIDYATDVKPLVVKVSKDLGRDAAMNILGKFKGEDGKPATKGQEVLPKDYAKLIAACEKALEDATA
jgi:hypothetical protein